MTLFDPYSHARIQELQQERLVRKARRREQLKLDAILPMSRLPISDLVRRIALRSTVKPAATARPSGRPALDS